LNFDNKKADFKYPPMRSWET